MSHQKIIAFYLRSATGNLVDLNRQKKILIQELARRRLGKCNIEPRIYIDTHQSGLAAGPEFLHLRQDVECGEINIVMVSRLNRISRSLKGLLEFYKFIERHKIHFVSVQENVDSFHWPSMQEVANEVR